jgi:hypothetical protein
MRLVNGTVFAPLSWLHHLTGSDAGSDGCGNGDRDTRDSGHGSHQWVSVSALWSSCADTVPLHCHFHGYNSETCSSTAVKLHVRCRKIELNGCSSNWYVGLISWKRKRHYFSTCSHIMRNCCVKLKLAFCKGLLDAESWSMRILCWHIFHLVTFMDWYDQCTETVTTCYPYVL